jgi:DNA ligase-1
MASDRIEVEFRRGIRIPEAGLWLDPWDRQDTAFVSHAHADHVAPHGETICSDSTRLLVERRFGSRGALTGLPFGVPRERNGFRLTLLPAGHVLGSAQIHLERIADGASLLYTGDFKLRSGLTAPAAQWRPARTLIMETTYGLPRYRFPPSELVLDGIAAFVRERIEDGEVPMLAAYALGKAQELHAALGLRLPGTRFLLHDSVARMTRVYEELGQEFAAWEEIGAGTEFRGGVVIAPPGALRSQRLRRVKPRATAMISGWGIDPSARFRYQVDEVFPLSDHADHGDLLALVERVAPEVVLTVHGFADEFAGELRRRGVEAWALAGRNQLELFADGVAAAPGDPATEAEESGEGDFAALAALADELRAACGRHAKTERLAEAWRAMGEEELVLALRFLSGRVFGRTEEGRGMLQVGRAVIRTALREASGRTEAELRGLGVGQNDLARLARLALAGRTRPHPWRLGEVRARCEEVTRARGPAAKSALLAGAFSRMGAPEGGLLTGILAGELRVGVQEGLLEEGLARAWNVPVAEVHRAAMLTGDLGEAGRLAREGTEALRRVGVRPFVPVSAMLASPAADAAEIWARLAGSGGGGVWLEDKFDGIRAQLHRVGERVEVFSRDLRPLGAEFRELLGPARNLAADLILDGEIVAWAEGRRLTFFDLQKRLGRKGDGDLFFGPEVPVRFVVFDLLWRDGESWLERPLRERREALLALELSAPFEPVAATRAGSVAEIEKAFREARARGNEGLIAKDEASPYAPGRRGFAWLKLKKALATLDCVVVRAEEGHGKRSHVLSDYTFAVRDEENGRLVVLGKAYSGLDDAEIEELTRHFLERTLEKRRRIHEVLPDVVLEIAFDAIRPSDRHESGLALRFPRIQGIRRDKTVDDIDTLATARKLAGGT